MRIRPSSLIIIVLIAFNQFIFCDQNLQKMLFGKEVRERFRSEDIRSFAVYYMPWEIATAVAVTPNQLTSATIGSQVYKMEAPSIDNASKFIEGFLEAVDPMTPWKDDSFQRDFRWAFVFYNKDRKEIFSI